MKLIEIAATIGPRKAYSDVDPQYMDFRKGDRVLPAPYFEDRKIMFTFKEYYEPGTKGWPDGGYDVYGPTGDIRAYYLDQLILHPDIIKRRHKVSIDTNKSGAKRGRKAGSETKVVKANGNGKRGRPSVAPELRKNKPYVATGLPRGRRKKVE
jgi:hypothetical protein